MPWYNLIPESWKKRACRYLLQRYVGHFLQEKLSLDQLSVDLYSGKGVIKELNLDVEALNDALENFNIPLEIVDGFIGSISVSIPWSSLLTDSTIVEVTGLELTIQPKEWDDSGATLDTLSMLSSMNMTSSLQLAQEVIQSEKTTEDTGSQDEAQPFDGVQMFAQTIDSVLSRVRMSFIDTTVRLEHLPKGADSGMAIELRINRMDYFDEISTEQEHGSPVDEPSLGSLHEPAGIALKNVHIMGVSVYFDEFFRNERTEGPLDSLESSPKDFESAANSVYTSLGENLLHSGITTQPKSLGAFPLTNSHPVQIAALMGRQEFKVKLKQQDALSGPKLELDCTFGAFHLLLSPRQFHGILELASGLASPATSDDSNSKKRTSKDKPMNQSDFQRVEHELQKHLQSGRMEQHHPNLTLPARFYNQEEDSMMQSVGELQEEDLYFSMHANRDRTDSELETSFSSIHSGSTTRTGSIATTYSRSEASGLQRQSSVSSTPKSPKDTLQKMLDDPAAELSRYRLKVSFISVNILHENPTSTPGDHFSPEIPASEKLKKMSEIFFNKAKSISFSGVAVTLKDLREKFSDALPYDHLGCLGKPLTLECAQKTSRSRQSLSLDITLGLFEAVECLFDWRNFTSSLMGFSLPIDNKLPQYTELLIFDGKDGAENKPPSMYSSMHGGAPALKLKVISAERTRSGSKSQNIPKTNVRIELGQFKTELDITIVDRINSLLTPEPVSRADHNGGRFRTSYNQQYTSLLGRQCFDQAMEESPLMEEKPMDFSISSSCATITFRFPIPDLRTGSQVDRLPWFHRNLHKEVLILELKNFSFQTSFGTTSPQQKFEFTASDVAAHFQEDFNKASVLLATVTSDDSCDVSEREGGFSWPRLVITSNQKVVSVLEDQNGDSDDSTPMDSLNGACQFAKSEPSPFSARKSMYEQEDLSMSDRSETKHTSEEMVLPGDKEEMRDFQEKSTINTKLLVEISLPIVTAFLPNKHIFEVLYNRVNNDLLMWEPMAPSPLQTQKSVAPSQQIDLNMLHLIQQGGDHEKFEMAKSGLQYESDSESDENDPYYSIHDGRRRKHRAPEHQLQSKLCFSLNIMKGKLLAVIPYKEEKRHGEVLIELDDATLFSVVSYNGDPDLRYLCFQANKAAMGNCSSATHPVFPGDLDQIKNDSIPEHIKPRIYKSERGVASKLGGCVGCGPDSPDMLSVAVKIKLDTINNVKEYCVSIGVRGGTLRHKMVPGGESWISQCLEFLDVKDYPILGYTEPKVITELHVHLWGCAVDYRPVYLPVRAMLTAEAFSISSNIVAQSPTTLLRFHLDDAALYLSDKKYMEVNLRKDYVCVADLERFELSLRTSDGKDQKYPKTDLRITSNRVNIRTCSDSCRALIELIQYFAEDGDLMARVVTKEKDNEQSRKESVSSRESSEPPEMSTETVTMSESKLEQVHNMMADAMQESSGSTSSSDSPDRQLPGHNTQVFFLPEGESQGQSHLPPAGIRPIVISNSAESVTSSTLSDKTEKLSDDEEFCIIDDAGWGIAPRDGEPAIRVFTQDQIVMKEDHFSQPIGKTDQLKPPEHFPPAEYRYTLKELTVAWYMYGGRDFSGERPKGEAKEFSSAESSPKPERLSLLDLGKPFYKPEPRKSHRHVTWQARGGPGRDLNTLMELQLSKVRCQHEVYPTTTKQASRQVLIIQEFEIRDRLESSQINKFLYQHTSESMPRQTHANMVLVKANHTRPDSSPAQECSLKVSLLPLRLNIDQDSLFFLRKFFIELQGGSAADPTEVHISTSDKTASTPKPATSSTLPAPAPPPLPVMAITTSPLEEEEHDQELLIMFDEMNLDQDGVLRTALSDSTSSTGSDQPGSQPVFFKSFIFSPDVPIRLDYHGKRVDMEQGTLAGLLIGLAQLNSSELKLKRLNYKHGLLGLEKLVSFVASEWLTDIRKNQLPSILGGVGPMYSFVQIVQGVKDLFWLPVEQYRKDGRIVRGIQRGASSFTTSTAMALLELTNKLVQSIQYVAELTYDMLSPGPSVRVPGLRRLKQHGRRGQPTDIREGMTNAYIVIREGITGTAQNLVRAATEEQEQKGLTGVVGGVLRQIPPTVVQPVIIATEATSKVLGGMRNQLRPEAKKEDEEKWRYEKS